MTTLLRVDHQARKNDDPADRPTVVVIDRKTGGPKVNRTMLVEERNVADSSTFTPVVRPTMTEDRPADVHPDGPKVDLTVDHPVMTFNVVDPAVVVNPKIVSEDREVVIVMLTPRPRLVGGGSIDPLVQTTDHSDAWSVN